MNHSHILLNQDVFAAGADRAGEGAERAGAGDSTAGAAAAMD
jgi:hypothetical protein